MKYERWRVQDWWMRQKYRFICWFYDKPDALSRRVKVENKLIEASKSGTGLSASECMQYALLLGTPTWRGKNGTKDGSREGAGHSSGEGS